MSIGLLILCYKYPIIAHILILTHMPFFTSSQTKLEVIHINIMFHLRNTTLVALTICLNDVFLSYILSTGLVIPQVSLLRIHNLILPALLYNITRLNRMFCISDADQTHCSLKWCVLKLIFKYLNQISIRSSTAY